MDKVKVIKQYINSSLTGYYDKNNRLILHSFNDEPAEIHENGNKYWYKDGKRHRDIGVGENNQPNYLPAFINSLGESIWYDHDIRYWIIENIRYNSVDEILEKYKDKIINVNEDFKSYLLHNDCSEFIMIEYDIIKNKYIYLISDDTQRNEVILKYG